MAEPGCRRRRPSAVWPRRLAADPRRLLGNGNCTRPVALDRQSETICERCGFYETGRQFVEILRRQHGDAIDYGDHDRAHLYTQLLDGIDDNEQRQTD